MNVRFKGRLFFWGAALAALAFLVFLNEGVWRTWQRRRQIRALRSDISRVKKDIETARREIELLESDETYLQVLAHRDLGYLKKDEIEIRFVPETSGEKTHPREGG